MEIREIALFASGICLILFAGIGMIDGLYLHLWRFRLHEHAESRNEHQIHTIRAVLFPAIVLFAFDPSSQGPMLWIGAGLALLDMLTLGVDALSEGDSRAFMGGLPKWEYVIHLFANGFHFAAIALALAARPLEMWGWQSTVTIEGASGANFLSFVGSNVMPGAIALAVLHVALLNRQFAGVWQRLQLSVKCC
jgi:hypothetical protein